MNRLFMMTISLLMAGLFQQAAMAQEKFKFGKVSNEEMTMTQYAPDTSAAAVILYKQSEMKFTYNSTVGKFGTETEYVYRVKILKPEGKSYADVTIPFYVSEEPDGVKEHLDGIKAVAYNMENGKIKESELSKKYIFEEKSSGNWRIMKFSIPNVEAGSVIEYKYTHLSNDPYHLDPWEVQGKLPVRYATHRVQIPEYFHYKFETKGYEHIDIGRETVFQAFNVGVNVAGQASVACNVMTFTVKDIPAVNDEPFLWCVDDYLTCVEFELDGVKFGDSGFKSYASNWDMVKRTLRDFDRFGGMMGLENPYQENMRMMQVSQLPFEEKLRAIFLLLKNKMKWNGKYALTSKDIKDCIKQGSGSNADLNFVLMAMLRDAGIKAVPILLRTRTEGRLPFRPTVDKLNTFVVAAYTSDGKPYYLDGSIEYGDLNILSPALMTTQGVAFDDAPHTQFVDLSNVGRTSTAHNVFVTIRPDGTFEGVRQTVYNGQSAANFKRRMANEKDSVETMRETEEEFSIRIKGCDNQKTGGLGVRCVQKLTFDGEFLANDDHIYLNPMIFPDETESPFTNVTRKFPVEFPYSQSVAINSTLTIPDGYQVEELPQNARSFMNHNELEFSYFVRQKDNQITIQYKASVNTPFIASEQYEELRNFWEEMVKRNNQQIVLKKIPVQP